MKWETRSGQTRDSQHQWGNRDPSSADPWQRRTMGGDKIKLTSDWASGQSVNAEHFLLWLCKISSTDPFKTLMSKWLSNAKCQLANFSSARHLVSEMPWWWSGLDCNKWWSSPSQCYICKHNLSLKPVTSQICAMASCYCIDACVGSWRLTRSGQSNKSSEIWEQLTGGTG